MGNFLSSVKEKRTLNKANPELIDDLPFKNKIILARVVDVYDGDTCTVIFKFGNKLQKLKIRVIGIDTPELKPQSKNSQNKDKDITLLKLEKIAAEKIKNDVENLILNKVLKVKFLKWDKYGGRVNGEIFLSKYETLSEYLIRKNYARKYNGEKKKEWTKFELNKIIGP